MTLFSEIDAFIRNNFPSGSLCDGYNFLWMHGAAYTELESADVQRAADLVCSHSPAWLLAVGPNPSHLVTASRAEVRNEIFQSDYDTPRIDTPVWALDLTAPLDVSRLSELDRTSSLAIASPEYRVVVNLSSRRVEAPSRRVLDAFFDALGRPKAQPPLHEEVSQYMSGMFPASLKYGSGAYEPMWLGGPVRQVVDPAHTQAVYDLMCSERYWVIAVSNADPERMLSAARVHKLEFKDPLARFHQSGLASGPGWFAECPAGSPPIDAQAQWITDSLRFALIAPDSDIGLQRYNADYHALFAQDVRRLAGFQSFVKA